MGSFEMNESLIGVAVLRLYALEARKRRANLVARLRFQAGEDRFGLAGR